MKKFLPVALTLVGMLAFSNSDTIASNPYENSNNLTLEEDKRPSMLTQAQQVETGLETSAFNVESYTPLGTMGGSIQYLTSSLNPTIPTYTRVYRRLGGSDVLRRLITEIGDFKAADGWIEIGNSYRFGGCPYETLHHMYFGKPLREPNPNEFQDTEGVSNFSTAEFLTNMKRRRYEEEKTFRDGVFMNRVGGGCFQVLKKLEGSDTVLSCYKYALRTYGERLEQLAQKPMSEIIHALFFNIDDLVRQFFEPITGEPQDGDLIIYENVEGYHYSGQTLIGSTHAGIYRHTSSGGVVESKWGWLRNPYVFLHDVFFASHSEGNRAKFYRLKKVTE